MTTHSSVLAWRIPGTEEPGGLPSMGSHRVRHDWSDLAAAAVAFVPRNFMSCVRPKAVTQFRLWKHTEMLLMSSCQLFHCLRFWVCLYRIFKKVKNNLKTWHLPLRIIALNGGDKWLLTIYFCSHAAWSAISPLLHDHVITHASVFSSNVTCSWWLHCSFSEEFS